MAYDEGLAERFRDALAGLPEISEKKMMGGVCFLMSGNMIGGTHITKQGEAQFLFRVGKDNEAEALERPGASIMINGTRRMGGFIIVNDEDCDDAAMTSWVSLCLSFVGNLPAKA